MSNAQNEKLQRGLDRLHNADDDPDQLGLALQSLHGALEDHCRALLATHPAVPAEQQAMMHDVRQVQWRDLLDLMEQYAGLTMEDRSWIVRENDLRQQVAHGGAYTGSRAELERYAVLVQRLLQQPAGPTQPRMIVATDEEAAPTGRTRRTRTGSARSLRARWQPDDTTRPTSDDAPRSTPATPRRAPRARPAASTLVVQRVRRMLQRNKPAWIAGAALLCVVLLGILVVTQRSGNDAATQTQATPLGEGDGRVLGMATPVLATATPAPPTPRTAVVRGVGTDALRVRQAPSLTGEVVFSVGDETEVTVIEGPVQADGYEWWQIEFDGVRGWCVGEYLEIAGG